LGLFRGFADFMQNNKKTFQERNMKFKVSAYALIVGFLIIVKSVPTFADNHGKVPDSPDKPKIVITLEEALRLAISKNLNLAAVFYDMEARNSAAHQATLWPNPELVLEFEEFGSTGEFSGTDVMSSKIGISQEFILGGKLSKLRKLAEGEERLTMLEKEAQAIALSAEVSERFLDVYIAQEKLKLTENDLQLTRDSAEVISKRVISGEASPLEETKFVVEVAVAETASKRMVKVLDAARLSLASTWGTPSADFNEVSGDFLSQPSIQEEGNLLGKLKRNPAYLLLEEKVAQAETTHQLAKAEAIPDIEIGGGVQHFNETDDHAYLVEVSIPLPFVDRNQGGIAEAHANLNKLKKEQEAGELEMQTSLISTLYELEGVWDNYISVRNTIVPASEESFASVQKAYSVGEQDYLDLLESQRSLLEARQQELELLDELWQLKLAVNALVGQPLMIGKYKTETLLGDRK
jgi:cobalt-zinc-cadmium efflux system outer membrane protein